MDIDIDDTEVTQTRVFAYEATGRVNLVRVDIEVHPIQTSKESVVISFINCDILIKQILEKPCNHECEYNFHKNSRRHFIKYVRLFLTNFTSALSKSVINLGLSPF